MLSVPAVTPCTTPSEVTVALPLSLLHVPLPASVSVVLAPTQRPAAPVMLPAEGDEPTVIVVLAVSVPQKLLITYWSVTVPVVMPVTAPDPKFTVATDVGVMLQKPPVFAPVYVVGVPVHIVAGPVIGPATGGMLITMFFVADTVPHALVTEYLMVS